MTSQSGNRFRRTTIVLAIAFAAAAVGTSTASAHNAGHIFIDGRCLEVGSSKEAPLVGQGAPQNALGQLDLIYDPISGVDLTDQYGARWAAIQGNTPILPSNCP
jgi:hypothetical protein